VRVCTYAHVHVCEMRVCVCEWVYDTMFLSNTRHVYCIYIYTHIYMMGRDIYIQMYMMSRVIYTYWSALENFMFEPAHVSLGVCSKSNTNRQILETRFSCEHPLQFCQGFAIEERSDTHSRVYRDTTHVCRDMTHIYTEQWGKQTYYRPAKG